MSYKEFNFAVSGLDYSVNGCVLAEKCLSLAGVDGKIYLGDVFSPSDHLIGSYDVAVSFGVVEHFSDTVEPVSHIANLLKPGGLIVTIIPNMVGLAGLAQKILCREVYEKHIPLTKVNLVSAHEKAGLTTVEEGYLEFVNFGVVNIGTDPLILARMLKLLVHKVLLGFTLVTWTFETIIGTLKCNTISSPYIFCIAKKK